MEAYRAALRADYVDLRTNNVTILHTEVALTSITMVSSAASVVGAIVILASIFFPDKKSLSRYIICFMSIADLMVALPAFVSCCYKLSKYPDDFTLTDMSPVLCKMQAYFIATGYLMSYIWTIGLAQHIYLLLRFGINAAIKAFLVLVVVSVLPFALNIYTYQADILGGISNLPPEPSNFTPIVINATSRTDINWCWINRSCENCYWMIYDGKGFEIVTYILISVYTVLAYRALMKHDSQFSGSPRAKKLILIPVIFIFSRIWGTIIVLQSVMYDCTRPLSDHPTWYSIAMRFLEGFFDNSQGWINWILFWWTIDGKAQFLRLVLCCREEEDQEELIGDQEQQGVEGRRLENPAINS